MAKRSSGSQQRLFGKVLREEVMNTLLAELLRDRQVPAQAERRSREGIPDIRVELPGGDTVIAECKWDEAAGPLKSQLADRVRAFPRRSVSSASSTRTACGVLRIPA